MRSLAAALAVVTVLHVGSLAHAQGTQSSVSDADRAAARELFMDGAKLQEQGKYAEALDRFKRAQSVVNAPTHLLHIAECDAMLGRLVESAETYRTLTRTALPPNAPPAFLQAQQKGAAELASVEPRIGSLRVTVTPENAPHLAVSIDGQPMSTALLGAARPTDPGAHTIVVTADGYEKAEQSVTLKEKEQRPVAIALQSLGGILGVIAVPQAAQGAPPDGSQGQPFDKPPVYTGPPETHHESSIGFMIGPRLGMALPGGALFQGSSVSDNVSAGFAFGGEAGLRFARHFCVGATFEHGAYVKSSSLDALASNVPTGTDLGVSAWSNAFGFDVAYVSNTEGIGFWGELGLGYRWMALDRKLDDNQGNFVDATRTFRGGELSLGVGVYVKLSDALRIVPKVTISGGQYTKLDQSCSSGGTALTQCSDVSGADITNTDSHTVVFLGATTYFDFARH